MEKRNKNEEIRDLGIDVEDEEYEEIEEEYEEVEDEYEEVEEDQDLDEGFLEMPKVSIESDTTNSNPQKHHHSYANPVNQNTLKWFLICVICVVLGVLAYGGYKVFFGSNEKEQTVEIKENKDKEKETDKEETDTVVNKDTEGPEFVGFLDRIVVNLNAVDVDFSKYYLAIDNDKQATVTVSGNVNLAVEGEYPITVSAKDDSGNTTSKDAIVQVISEDTMVMIPLDLTPMIDGSIPMAPDTKQRVDANVIMYYYGEVSQEIKDTLSRLGIDVSSYHLDTYWHPNDLSVVTY